ncbi:HYD1 signature containing ADP-ribosyltransferase family protein [Chromobacterium sp. LK11]
MKANNPKDVRYDDGQYLTDINPSPKTNNFQDSSRALDISVKKRATI